MASARGGQRGPKNESKEVQLSKAMTYILRHGAEKEGIPITKDGFVKLDDLLKHRSFNRATKDEIIKIVNECPKKRFYIERVQNPDTNSEEILIRANQGHSMVDLEVEMKEIVDSDPIDFIVHGTYFKFWNSIKQQGLSKMSRQHIHFAVDLPHSNQVISGMRSNCEIAIFVDVKKALKDGLKFYRSENNVILCPGNEQGFLSSKYFSKVLDIKKNTLIEDYLV